MVSENAIPPVVVHKYGGTTVGNRALLPFIVQRIQTDISSGKRVIVVVSAMGRKGNPYATDSLLEMLPDTPYICRREKDLLLACGEVISAVFLAGQLRMNGIPAIARAGFEVGIITDGDHGNARILAIDPERLTADFHIFPVVVIAGFQGKTASGKITTLGRGGSDTSAVALGIAFQAEVVNIFTDTDGVFSADPSDVQAAHLLPQIHAEDIRQMAWEGAKVVHPRAAELASDHHVNVTVSRIDNPGTQTLITPNVPIETRGIITSVTCGNLVHQFKVSISGLSAHRDATKVFQAIAGIGISMDMFNLMETAVWFTIPFERAEEAIRVLTRLNFPHQVVKDMTKVSIIGAGMHGMRGVMAQFSQCLLDAQVQIFQTVDSHATISALIRYPDRVKAQQALHRAFLETINDDRDRL